MNLVEAGTLIAAKSAGRNIGRRRLCEMTWMPMAESLGFSVCFAMADAERQEAVREYRSLWLPCVDGYYYALTYRLQLTCRWFLEYGYQYLFWCDDDTYIVAGRLAGYPAGRDFVGNRYYSRGRPMFIHGGSGMLLSRRAVEFLAEASEFDMRCDDVWASQVLQSRGISLTHDHRFCWSKRHPAPSPNNQVITAHYLSPSQWIAVHREVGQTALTSMPPPPQSLLAISPKTAAQDSMPGQLIQPRPQLYMRTPPAHVRGCGPGWRHP